MKFADWMEACNHKVIDTGEYQWDCYGMDVKYFESNTGYPNYNHGYIVCSSDNTIIYEINIIDYFKYKAYRYVNPTYKTALIEEYRSKGLEYETAYDDVEFIDLDSTEDILFKMKTIFDELPYDSRSTIELKLENNVLFALMKLAHEKDMSFNDFVSDIVRSYVDESSDVDSLIDYAIENNIVDEVVSDDELYQELYMKFMTKDAVFTEDEYANWSRLNFKRAKRIFDFLDPGPDLDNILT